MSLITDPLYLIHISRVKFLRMDERGERIITFPPTVMSDDYVRLAAPVYPEMQYCYSPVYDNYMNDSGGFSSGLKNSPRTTKRNYRHRKRLPSNANVRYNEQYVAPNNNASSAATGMFATNQQQQQQQQQQRFSSSRLQEATTDSEDDDVDVEDNSSKPLELEVLSITETVLTNEASTAAAAAAVAVSNTRVTKTAAVIAASSTRSYPSASLHPSVDSAIDPSPRSSIDEQGNVTFTTGAFTDSSIKRTNAINTANKEESSIKISTEITPPSPLEYTKKQLPILPHQGSSRPQHASALSALIAEKATAAENPFAEYSFISGKGESKPIKLCIYLPTSNKPYTPVSLVVRPDAITDDVIGYILYDYVEQKREPELEEAAYDLAEWVLLMAEDDGEIEDELPAVDRTRNIGRIQYDQFALCRATPTQAKQNDLDRAKMGRSKPDLETLRRKKQAATMSTSLNLPVQQQPAPSQQSLNLQEAVEDISDMEVDIPSQQQLEANTSPSATSDPHMNETIMSHSHLKPQQTISEPGASTVAVPVPSSKATLTKATMPLTPLKYFRIKLMTSEEVSATTSIPVYAEMFIGDVLELVSRKRKLDPNEYMLTIADSKVIVPNDTTVESMKGIIDLTLTKKGTALTIPSSTHLWRSPIKRKKDEVNHPMYFSTTDSPTAGPSAVNANDALLSQYKKYTVSRKMPMFVSKRLYIMAIDGDYIHLMPPEHKGMFDSVKTTSFHASAVRSCKQSKKVPTNFKIIILKERVFKTYDLEAESAKEANEICNRIHFLVQVTK